jgi:hypothetical protein
MCPVCMTTAVVVAAGTSSGAAVLGFMAVKFRWLQIFRLNRLGLFRRTKEK